jgi:transposase
MKGFKMLLPEHRTWKGDVMQTPGAVAAMTRLYALGWGFRRIAEEVGCSRNTIKHYLHQAGWAPYRSPARPRKLAPLEDWLATSFCQHRGHADVVRQELQRVHGVTVSLRTVARAVQPWRQQLAAEARATVRFETPPGRQ